MINMTCSQIEPLCSYSTNTSSVKKEIKQDCSKVIGAFGAVVGMLTTIVLFVILGLILFCYFNYNKHDRLVIIIKHKNALCISKTYNIVYCIIAIKMKTESLYLIHYNMFLCRTFTTTFFFE